MLNWPLTMVATNLQTAKLNLKLLDQILKHIAIIAHQLARDLLLKRFCNMNMRFLKVLKQEDEDLFLVS